jgi:hypothetical protein
MAALLTLGAVGVLVVASDQWAHPATAITQHVEALLADMEALTARLGLSGEAAMPLYGMSVKLRTFLLMAFPGLFFAGSLLTASGCAAAARPYGAVAGAVSRVEPGALQVGASGIPGGRSSERAFSI